MHIIFTSFVPVVCSAFGVAAGRGDPALAGCSAGRGVFCRVARDRRLRCACPAVLASNIIIFGPGAVGRVWRGRSVVCRVAGCSGVRGVLRRVSRGLLRARPPSWGWVGSWKRVCILFFFSFLILFAT